MASPRLDERGRPVDLHRRVIPHQLSAVTFSHAVLPGFLAQFTGRVPDEFYSLDRDEDDDDPMAVIACPCGGTPSVPVGQIRGCDCERVFIYTGREVLVAKGDGQGPSTELVRLDHSH